MKLYIWLFLLLAGCALLLAPWTDSSPLLGPTPIATTYRYKVYLPVIYAHAEPGPKHSPKKGMAPAMEPVCSDLAKLGATWFYQWGPWGQLCPGVESVPMIRDLSQIGSALGGNSQYLLEFNEPTQWDQSNLTVAQTIEGVHLIETTYPGRKFIAPAMILVDDYLLQVRDGYHTKYDSYPKWDALAYHCYTGTAQECIDRAAPFLQWASAWEIPGGVWVSEFAIMTCWSPDAPGETAKLLAWMEATPGVTRYSWFTNRKDANADKWIGGPGCMQMLMDDNAESGLSDLGIIYRGVDE